MEMHEHLNAIVLSTIVRDFPRGFWDDVRTAMRQSYLDVYHQIAADPTVLKEQRLDKLYQDRHFRMEHQLAKVAEKHELPCTPTLLHSNNRHFMYVTKGSIGMTQTYVQAIGAMPKPARFRTHLAAMNDIARTPSLDLGIEPREALLGKEFYGLIVHNPVGHRFTEDEQRLGMIQFCVPVKDFSEWALEMTIEEILAVYGSAVPSEKVVRSLPWKKHVKKEDGTK